MSKNKVIYGIIIIVLTSVLLVFVSINVNFGIKEDKVLKKKWPLNNNQFSKKLFNLNFKYILSGTECQNGYDILAIIIVTSYYAHVETRSAMRRAFPREHLDKLQLKRVFLLGTASNANSVSQNAILDEGTRFGDIVQGNFEEAYRNLTYKHVMGLQWATTYCNSAKYIIKMDDDIVINLYKVIDLLKNTTFPKKLLAGYVLNKMMPIREPANKWFVTKDEYEKPSYPTFVSGWFYITNQNTALQLVTLSTVTPYFWIDDVYISGVLAQKLQINHYDLSKYFTVHPEFLQCCMRDVKKFSYDCDILVGPNGGDNNLFYNFNMLLKTCANERCYKRRASLNDTCVAERTIVLGKGQAVIKKYQLV